jgi:RNA polymerase sigma-70 factor (ECF subfamily)
MGAAESNVIALHRKGDEPDAQLVRAASEGERWAKEALFRRHVKRLLGLAYRLMPEEDPEELVQETFIVALPRLKTLSNPASFGPWTSAVLVSIVRGRLRRQRWLRRLGMADPDPFEMESVVSKDAPPEVHDALVDLYRGLRRLTDEQRIAVVLQRVEGLELTEVAARMGLSVATVKRRVVEADGLLEEVKSND